MFITPLFGGCKYTNKFLIINNIAVFQHFNLLITHPYLCLRSLRASIHDLIIYPFELNEKLAVSLLSSHQNSSITRKSYGAERRIAGIIAQLPARELDDNLPFALRSPYILVRHACSYASLTECLKSRPS